MENASPAIPEKWAPRFFTIWGGQAVSLFGSSLVQFALIWYLTQETHSATVLAMASLAGMLPQVLIGPFAGVWVDRWNRRLIMIAADAVIALTTLGLVALFALGTVQIWQIYLAMVIRSLGGAFHYPAMSSSTSLMVPKQHLARIGGLNQTLQGLMGIVAPPAGALLVSVLPTQGVLMIDVITAIVGITPLLFLSIPQPVRTDMEARAGKPASSFWGDARDGLRFITSWPGLMIVVVMATLINFLLTPAGSLMPLLVTNHFGLGALAFGLTDTFWGVGMIAGGLVLGAWGGFKRKIATTLMGIAGIGIGALVVGLAPSGMFPLALAAMLLVGAEYCVRERPAAGDIPDGGTARKAGPRDEPGRQPGHRDDPAFAADRRPALRQDRHPDLVPGRRGRVCGAGRCRLLSSRPSWTSKTTTGMRGLQNRSSLAGCRPPRTESQHFICFLPQNQETARAVSWTLRQGVNRRRRHLRLRLHRPDCCCRDTSCRSRSRASWVWQSRQEAP